VEVDEERKEEETRRDSRTNKYSERKKSERKSEKRDGFDTAERGREREGQRGRRSCR